MAKKERSLEDALGMTPSLSSFPSYLAGPEDTAESQAPQIKKEKKPLAKKSKVSTTPKASKPSLNAQVTLSSRVSAELAQNLLEVSMKRKMKKTFPWTQQAILETALMEWLKKNS